MDPAPTGGLDRGYTRGRAPPGPAAGVPDAQGPAGRRALSNPDPGRMAAGSRTLADVRKWRFIGYLAAAIVVVFLMGALLIVVFTETTNHTTTFTGPIKNIVVNTERGSVTIRSGPAGVATVADQKRYVFTGPSVTEQLSKGTLTVLSNCPLMAFISCSADFTITAPAGTPINATAQRGLLTVSGMTGTVYSNSDSGSFVYTGPSPSVTAYSLNGNITLTFSAPPTYVHARTETGVTTVTVPPGAYAINANSGAGTHSVVGLVSVPKSPRSIYASSGDGAANVAAGS